MVREELLKHIDRIHTTSLGEMRITRNLKIQVDDVVLYLKSKILDSHCIVFKKGKNYYCEIDGIRITINSSNYCVITAHFL